MPNQADTVAITEAEWENLSENWPPVVTRDDGSLLIVSGIWSNGHRSYAYATVEVAQKWPEDAAAMGLVKIIDRPREKMSRIIAMMPIPSTTVTAIIFQGKRAASAFCGFHQACRSG